jgi:predicted HD phosphohydrolase
MDRLPSLEATLRLYRTRGAHSYGEGVTLLEHSLQSAALAREARATPALVAAALLHDVGHLLVDPQALPEGDPRHEVSGARALAGLFERTVRGPIALHVAAKRYLCWAEPGYFEALSHASQASLVLQGGRFDAAEAGAFRRRAFWREAVALRRFDDAAKRAEPCGLSLEDFTPLLRTLLTGPVRG